MSEQKMERGFYTKKPVTIEALQWTGENKDDILAFCPKGKSHDGTNFVIPTLEGRIYASRGDWIIKGVKGEFYPCKPDIFEMTYRAASTTLEAAPPLEDQVERLTGLLGRMAEVLRERDQWILLPKEAELRERVVAILAEYEARLAAVPEHPKMAPATGFEEWRASGNYQRVTIPLSPTREFHSAIKKIERNAWNAGAASVRVAPEAVGGGEAEPRIIKFGLGEIVSNWGTHEGVPAVFLEPADAAGMVGKNEFPQRGPHDLRSNAIALQFVREDGAKILMEYIASALGMNPMKRTALEIAQAEGSYCCGSMTTEHHPDCPALLNLPAPPSGEQGHADSRCSPGRVQELIDSAPQIGSNPQSWREFADELSESAAVTEHPSEVEGEKNEVQADVRMVRPVGGSVLGQEETSLVPLPITDDRDCDYVDPRLREEADLIVAPGPQEGREK